MINTAGKVNYPNIYIQGGHIFFMIRDAGRLSDDPMVGVGHGFSAEFPVKKVPPMSVNIMFSPYHGRNYSNTINITDEITLYFE